MLEFCGGSGGVGVSVYQGRRFPGCSWVRVWTPPALHRSRRHQHQSGGGQVTVTSEQCSMAISMSEMDDTPEHTVLLTMQQILKPVMGE